MSSSAKADDPVIAGIGNRHRLASNRVPALLDARLHGHDEKTGLRNDMVALKGADIDRFVARPDPARPIVLVFGPDTGLVRERAEALVRASVDDPKDPFQLARLDGDELAS